MLKLTEKQLEQAYRLALQIGRCEMAKDEEGQAMVRTGLYASTEIPVSREVVLAAAKADIARCHEELKAMGISLMPSAVTSPINSPWRTDAGALVGYYTPNGMGALVGGAIGGAIDRPADTCRLEDLKIRYSVTASPTIRASFDD